MTKVEPWDVTELLDTEEKIATYIRVAFEEAGDDPVIIAKALGDVARARGMTDMAKKTGLTRAALYKALSGEGNPEFGTIIKVAAALGYRLAPTRIAPQQ